MNKGDYVLATKYEDGDPGDQWCIGFYDRQEGDRHYVVDGDGKQFRRNGFRRVGLINDEYAAWLIGIISAMEKAPVGSVNLWGMMGDRAAPAPPDEDRPTHDSAAI